MAIMYNLGCMKRKVLLAISLLLLISSSAFADDITFSSGYTRVAMKGVNKTVELTENVKVSTGDIDITANKIVIAGENYSFLTCLGNVKVIDHKRDITIQASSLAYNRTTEFITIDGWVEMQDAKNEVSVSSAWLEFDLNGGILRLQLQTKILKSTSKGPMICKADNVTYDRNSESLTLLGNAKVDWNGDEYTSQKLSVDLKTEEIVMTGDIKGTVNG